MPDWQRAASDGLEPRGWMLDLAMWLCLGGLFLSCFNAYIGIGIVILGVLVLCVYTTLPWKRRPRR